MARLELWDKDGIPWREFRWPSAPPMFEVAVCEHVPFEFHLESTPLPDPDEFPRRRVFRRMGVREQMMMAPNYQPNTFIYREIA